MSTETLIRPTEPGGRSARRATSAVARPTQVVTFRLGSEHFGIDIMQVQEIILVRRSTCMPGVPEHVRGLHNLRGHVIPVLDLRRKFGLQPVPDTEHSRIVVVNVNKRTAGLVVDAVEEVLRVSAEQIEPPPSAVVAGGEYMLGLVKLDERLVILLNAQSLIAEELDSALTG